MKALLLVGMSVVYLSYSSAAQNDIATLKKLNRSFLDAIVNRDTASLSNILADDFILINPGGFRQDKAHNLANVILPNQQVLSVDIDSVDVRLLSINVGLVAAWTTNVINADGTKSTLKISYQDVYMKRKNKWVAVAAHVTLLEAK